MAMCRLIFMSKPIPNIIANALSEPSGIQIAFPVHPEIDTVLAYAPPNSASANGVNLERPREEMGGPNIYAEARPFAASVGVPVGLESVTRVLSNPPKSATSPTYRLKLNAMLVLPPCRYPMRLFGEVGIARQNDNPKNHSILGV